MQEIEENNRMGKTRDLFKKIGDTKGTFHAKMSKINSKDLAEAGEIRGGGKEASLQIKLVEVMEFQLSYFKS